MKYSIKQLLIAIVSVSFYFACVAGAVRGSAVGWGLTISIPAIAIWFISMAAVYWAAIVLSKLTSKFTRHRPTNPETSTTEVSH